MFPETISSMHIHLIKFIFSDLQIDSYSSFLVHSENIYAVLNTAVAKIGDFYDLQAKICYITKHIHFNLDLKCRPMCNVC